MSLGTQIWATKARKLVFPVGMMAGSVTDMQYPKSLGELCIESYADARRSWVVHRKGVELPTGKYQPAHLTLIIGKDDCDALRITMYHKNRSEE